MTRALEKRLQKIEAARTNAVQGDLAARIVAARRDLPRPRRTRATLERLALDTGLAGRLARGDLRIKRIGSSTAMITDPERELAQAMGEFYANPLGFVMWAYEWGRDPALRVVKLPEAWVQQYDCEFGPEAWACELLEEIGRAAAENSFDGTAPVEAIRQAVSSGHGISKSATTAMIVGWIMSTRPHARGVVTASTAVQLESKTWAEIAKWNKRCITGEWFTITTGKGAMRMTHSQYAESWRCDAQTCREENSEAFAGLHAANSTPFYIFDEASAVPDAVKEVAEGGLTDGEPMMFAFGNPTRNTGWFHACFNAMRHRWKTRQIDSRDVTLTNKTLINEWIKDFGIDSDFVKVRVRGMFPSASSLQFIPRDLVDEAMTREAQPAERGEPAVVGVDVARFGDDQSVIRTRIGRNGRDWKPIRLRGVDTMQLASRVAEHVNYLRGLGLRVYVFVDGGGVGGGVVDRLSQLGQDVMEVQFGGRADDQRKYANKRAEMWGRMKEWLKGGVIEKDEVLATDLAGVEYSFNAHDQIQLERKESMRSRGLASPDDADALALTFAFPVPAFMYQEEEEREREQRRRARDNYDPYASDSRGHDPFAAFEQVQ